MTRQIRRWDFDTYDSSREVRVLLYVRFAGAALSDPSGRVGDPEAYFPRTDTGEVWLTFAERDSAWRVVRSEPALPNFKDILSFATGPYDGFGPGPDKRTR